MHLFLGADEASPFLIEELRRAAPARAHEILQAGLVRSELDLVEQRLPVPLAFAWQALLNVQPARAGSIRAWHDLLWQTVTTHLPQEQPWHLHVVSHYGVAGAGAHRCQLIREALRETLGRKRRSLRRLLRKAPVPFAPADSLVQLLLTGPDAGWLSLLPAPAPFENRQVVSPFAKGEIPVAEDKSAPSRAFAKLVEAELRLGRRIGPGETCVDLGASPGSWTYVAVQRGARVVAVDRSPLREDLMRTPLVRFEQGNAFTFEPPTPVDWLLCDVIAAPERSMKLLLQWLRRRWMRHFVVTIKFKGTGDYAQLDLLKREAPSLATSFHLTHLCANRNEVCAFGSV
ncbi:MAG TPA: SAM-dependent methyltransferase [Methylomirabilota bacterium]|nr:SAM-dependent methyltransferase [Methylomirabilota bacterium]